MRFSSLLGPVAVIFAVALVLAATGLERRPPEVAAPRAARWRISDPGQNIIPWAGRPPEANNLSGIALVEGGHYAMVSDHGAHLLWAEIAVDPDTGVIRSAKVLPQVATLAGCVDMEGCALSPDRRSLVVSDEDDTGLTVVPMLPGQAGVLKPLAHRGNLLSRTNENLSLESLATCVDGSGYWTMNEDALAGDGPRASRAGGAWLRLQKNDLQLNPVRQWAYCTDPIPASLPIPFAISGVSDVLALPDGGLLVMERALSAEGFRLRLYNVFPVQEAPDVTAVAALDGAGATPLTKKLLYEWRGKGNFEGIAHGPELKDGRRSLLLVTDDGDGFSESGVMVLRLERLTD